MRAWKRGQKWLNCHIWRTRNRIYSHFISCRSLEKSNKFINNHWCLNNGLLYSPKAKVVFLLYLAWYHLKWKYLRYHLKWKYLRARWFRFILSIKNSMHLSGKFYSALSNWRPKFVFTGWKLCLNKVIITISRIESPFALARSS